MTPSRTEQTDRERVLARWPDAYCYWSGPKNDRRCTIVDVTGKHLLSAKGTYFLNEKAAWTSAAERMDKGE